MSTPTPASRPWSAYSPPRAFTPNCGSRTTTIRLAACLWCGHPWTTAALAIARAQAFPGSSLRCVTIEDLVALKLYAGGLGDHADVVELLARNPDVDLDAVRATASPFDRQAQLESLIEQSAVVRRRRR